MKTSALVFIIVASILIAGLIAALAVTVSVQDKASVPFPVDVVCTWVDGTDKDWLSKKHDAYNELIAGMSPADVAGVAYNAMRDPEPIVPGQRDELFYSAHSIAKFMPWVRRYYLVTMRPHKPAWWPASGRIGKVQFILVHHDEIAGGPASKLPTFNSIAIQTFLPNIPDLAEHFILFDDDFFVGQPLKATHFYTKKGMPVIRSHALRIPTDEGVWRQICINNKRLIESQMKSTGETVLIPEHVATPCLKSVFSLVITDIAAEDAKRVKTFRSVSDFVLQYVMAGYLINQGAVEDLPSSIETKFFNTGGLAKYASGKKDLPHLFCVNDRITADDRKVLDRTLGKVK